MSLTVEKALQLIEALARGTEPLGVTQLGRDLHLNKSTVFRLVDTLVRHGYARQTEDGGRYMLTAKLWELGVGVVHGMDLRQAARPYLEREAADSGESTLLGILQGNEALIVDKVDSTQTLGIFSKLGTRVPLGTSSLGRALLAFQPPEFIATIVAEFEPRTGFGIQTRDDLERDLARIREQCYARSCDEWHVGVAGVAAPVRDASGAIVGSFCITGPTTRLGQHSLDTLSTRCIKAAEEISKRMGHP